MKINGESCEVSGATVDSWKESLPEVRTFEILMKWPALPYHGFSKKEAQCKGGKKARHSKAAALIPKLSATSCSFHGQGWMPPKRYQR